MDHPASEVEDQEDLSFPQMDDDVLMIPAHVGREYEPDFQEHRQVYIGMHHVPTDKQNQRRGNKSRKFNLGQPKIFRWENGKKTTKLVEDSGSEGEVNDNQLLPAPASERVKFILGGSGENEEEATQENPQLFTELEELCVHLDGNVEWKETARWFKYEEDVEEGGDRWSKPHVATLSLYSLFELRSSLMAGTVILDMEALTLSEVADNVLDNLISCNKLEEIFRFKVRDTLLRKHRHQRNVGFRRNLSNIISGRKSFQNSSINGLKTVPSNGVIPNSPTINENQNKSSGGEQSVNTTPKLFRNFSQPAFPTQPVNLRPHVTFERSNSTQGHLVYPATQQNTQSNTYEQQQQEDEANEKMPAFLKRLPPNAEASNILVGEVDFLEKPITAFVRLAKSSVIGDLTEVPIPTRFLFIMLGPCLSPGRYHEIGRAISTLMADDVFHDVAYKAKSRDDLIAGIDEFLEQVTVLPPGEWDPSIRIPAPVANGHAKIPRRCTITESKNVDTPIENFNSGGSDTADSTDGSDSSVHFKSKTFSSLKNDFNIWKSREKDISDGLNLNSFGTAFFIYFLLLSFVITIGNHLDQSTGGYMGMREQILAIGITGLASSIFSTQPLLIIASVIPLVLFDGFLYSFCDTYGIDYLPFRMWTGIWCVILVMIYLACDIANFVYYLSRFSLEIFVVLSPLVLLGYGFVYLCKTLNDFSHIAGTFENRTCKCIKYLFHNMTTNVTIHAGSVVLDEHLRDCVAKGGQVVGDGCEHDIYPFGMLLTLFTIIVSIFFTSFKHFGYLPKQINHIIHSFTTFIVVCVMSAIACQFNVNINYLKIFSSFTPHGKRTSWFVPLIGDNQYWILIASVIPAVFLSMIIFSEQIFTACHINRNSMILKKRVGYHLDIFLLLFGALVSSVLGLPFCVSSAILSVNHIQSLTVKSKVEDLVGAFITIKEQRVSSFLVYVFIMLTPLMTPALRYIPHAVLHGIMLLALIRTFYNVQFAVRFGLLFMPKSHHPDNILYIRQVPLISANAFTVIQVLCTAALWAVRATSAAIVFPIGLLVLVGLRYLLEYILPVRDVHVMDEPVPSINASRCCGKKNKQENLSLMGQLESGLLSNEQPVNEDVVPDYNIVNGRVNIAEELSKTAAWKQLMHGENSNSGVSNSPKIDRQNSRKRRKKRNPGNTDNEINKKNKDTFLLDELDAPFKKEDLKNTIPKERAYNSQPERKSSKRKKSSSKKSDRNSLKELRTQHKQKKINTEETSVPPWEQPYHSPPRKDFGLLKIPENDCSVDPACSRSESLHSENVENSVSDIRDDTCVNELKKSLDSLDNQDVESNEESRYASSEPDD